MNNKELAKFLDISEQALYKWRKERPNLYKIAMFYKEKLNDSLGEIDEKTKLLLSHFERLTDKEKEYYLSDIQTRLLKKEIDEK